MNANIEKTFDMVFATNVWNSQRLRMIRGCMAVLKGARDPVDVRKWARAWLLAARAFGRYSGLNTTERLIVPKPNEFKPAFDIAQRLFDGLACEQDPNLDRFSRQLEACLDRLDRMGMSRESAVREMAKFFNWLQYVVYPEMNPERPGPTKPLEFARTDRRGGRRAPVSEPDEAMGRSRGSEAKCHVRAVGEGGGGGVAADQSAGSFVADGGAGNPPNAPHTPAPSSRPETSERSSQGASSPAERRRRHRRPAEPGWIYLTDAATKYDLPGSTAHDFANQLVSSDRQTDEESKQVLVRESSLRALLERKGRLTP
jgi:hypothetical protein